MISLQDRIQGCLIGAGVGSELGFSRTACPERSAVSGPEDLCNIPLRPVGDDYQEEAGRVNFRAATPFVDVGVRAFLAKQGRVTPEDFGALLRDDEALSGPVFLWDGVHSVQELLKEGMSPRLTGLGIAPCGNICAAMPAVGIFHCGDPEYAYLDGVELGSVAQPRLGADWAGLCAAAIAAAFVPEATAESVVTIVLKLAHQNNKELFYQINHAVRHCGHVSEDQFLHAWLVNGGPGGGRQDLYWTASNPMLFILPLLNRYADDAVKLFSVLLAPNSNGASVNAVIAGAIIGALHGPSAFPQEWRDWAELAAAPWLSLAAVVRRRLKKEQSIVAAVERLAEQREDGDSQLFEKVHGCLLAGAIGNAMGSPVEGRFYWEVDEQHPGGITTLLDPSRLEGEDDNQMAMHLVETYIERDGLPVMARHFGETWRKRLNRDHFFPHCMGNAYDLICAGWDPRITGHWSQVTGSTVMCMEPVGVYHLCDSEFAAIDATAISYMYQRGLDVVAATMLAATVAEALHPDATVDSVCQAALTAAPESKLITFDKRTFASAHEYVETCLEIAAKYDDVLAAQKELYEKCLLYHMIDPLEVWGFSLAMFKIARGDVRQAAIGGTNIGRDSDTIAGRAAMLSGTLKGARTVPQDWLDLVPSHALERVRRNALRLTRLISDGKLARVRERASWHSLDGETSRPGDPSLL
ncbi:MAG: hypothetical protein AUJ92_08200 [Armatimonadetes bacterium CG2_30_59_28]|nr:hypothetical protein [Armatimonadota bacterium]OIO95287.1 MAG: hypothetical protein AUJ92_08200 [Armatimonadetes bacterium CG2_30_59_28]PIU67190.1 MAG: hypothetical protein COS85_01710 [Armatimonadetes bacterium CG07_land_8_20_14_0_80_59_28]PIX43963.1 MAG: hypothetical protein COZ56_05860 [Armatimonadetes bacterium CG_4_8_14_3_um_filter_58_9]PIY43424.1 MAG: hypothetical protein COZ05_11095 [Armatimonadetes bacterium CG_4_10_14_3_um_filter_59_10]